MRLNKDDIKIYEILYSMAIQFILVAAALTSFFIILSHLLKAASWFELVKDLPLELVLSGTLYAVYKYFFPFHKR